MLGDDAAILDDDDGGGFATLSVAAAVEGFGDGGAQRGGRAADGVAVAHRPAPRIEIGRAGVGTGQRGNRIFRRADRQRGAAQRRAPCGETRGHDGIVSDRHDAPLPVDPRLELGEQRGDVVVGARQVVGGGLRLAQPAVEEIAAHERRLVPRRQRADVGGAVLLRRRGGGEQAGGGEERDCVAKGHREGSSVRASKSARSAFQKRAHVCVP